MLFDPDKLPTILLKGERELVLALQAVCLRYLGEPPSRQIEDRINGIASLARRLVMERLARFDIELSTLQALCLLSIADLSGKCGSGRGLDLQSDHSH